MYRWATAGDFHCLGQIMFEAVHALPSPYSKAQRTAWIDRPRTGPDWEERLRGQDIALVLDPQNPDKIKGFASLSPNAYVDFVFLLPEVRQRGHFRTLIEMLIARARTHGFVDLATHASLAAQGPFAALGFELVHHETVSRAGQSLPRALMHLTLPPLDTGGESDHPFARRRIPTPRRVS